MNQGVTIGQASKECGIKAPTIRYYEQIQLLPSPPPHGRQPAPL